MSFDPLALPGQRYSGTPGFTVVRDNTLAGTQPNARFMGKRFVPLTFNWLIYFTAAPTANIAVPIDIAGGSVTGGLLDKIETVKIDNSNSTISVSVFFPDTNDLITCPPNTIVTLPAMTNGLKCWVIAQGLAAGFTPTTKIYLINYVVAPSIDPQLQTVFPQELATPLIQNGVNQQLTPGYAPRALGDAMFSLDWRYDNIGNFVNVLNSPRPNGYFIITGIQCISLNGQGSAGYNQLDFGSTGTFGLLFKWFFLVPGTVVTVQPVYDQSNLQLRIPADQEWRLTSMGPQTIGSANSRMSINIQYTYIPG